jgi:hypothetical protein
MIGCCALEERRLIAPGQLSTEVVDKSRIGVVRLTALISCRNYRMAEYYCCIDLTLVGVYIEYIVRGETWSTRQDIICLN